ncbi:MAG: FAD-dependent oxidoreductase, partial [Bacteroidota bacterium]|nr:FAD-dependent oxidoreductase [Bacteroidota bacterium]
GEDLIRVRGFIVKNKYPEPVQLKPDKDDSKVPTYICHCDDVTLEDVMKAIGDRKFISVDEVKHITRLGMGPCRGKRCVKRLKQRLSGSGITVIGDPTPRGPLANQITMGQVYPPDVHERVIMDVNGKAPKKIKVQAVVAGGGMAGSSLFRYLSEAGMNPVLINSGRGSSWRNIAGGRPNFSVPELSEIAERNHDIFRELEKIKSINYRPIDYITFAHDDAMYKSLVASMAWSDAYMVEPKDFQKEISPWLNPSLPQYKAALITRNCWQATPGKTIDLIRSIGKEHGGMVEEDSKLLDVRKEGKKYFVLARNHGNTPVEYETEIFVNALGYGGEKFARMLGINTGLYTVKHQAFITRRLPMMGKNGDPLGMVIDRRKYKGFIAVYGQQLAETGQIIGCASPLFDSQQTAKNIRINTEEFLSIATEVFIDWIPALASVNFQATWAGYYVEPRMIIDPDLGLFLGMRGQGFMLSQYVARMYADKLLGRPVPSYFSRLALSGDGLPEEAFK